MRILDNFITNPEVIAVLEKQWDSLPPDTTAWLDIDHTSTTVWHALIHTIWGSYPESLNALGFEYWQNTLTSGGNSSFSEDCEETLDAAGPMVWHKDKDEEVYRQTSHIVTCDLGAIYYPFNDEFVGGYLEIANNDDFDEVERIQAKANRLIIFNPSYYHRVSKIYSGTRRCFVVNAWRETRPTIGRKALGNPEHGKGQVMHA
tara:strand:+ start:565 stop:1173 length:609 start_codon:yes stop_codon:yes gene_type:complete